MFDPKEELQKLDDVRAQKAIEDATRFVYRVRVWIGTVEAWRIVYSLFPIADDRHVYMGLYNTLTSQGNERYLLECIPFRDNHDLLDCGRYAYYVKPSEAGTAYKVLRKQRSHNYAWCE